MDEKIALDKILNFLIDAVPLEKLPKADAIFICGHIDKRIPEHAAFLFSIEKASKIIVSGKGRKEIPGFESEAAYFAEILMKVGVPRENLLLEGRAANTLENILFGMEACEKIYFSPKSLILVAMPPLLRRARATFLKQFPGVVTYGSGFEISRDEYAGWMKRLIAEFDRFDEYFQKGDIAKITVPSDVQSSLAFLKTLPTVRATEPHFYPSL